MALFKHELKKRHILFGGSIIFLMTIIYCTRSLNYAPIIYNIETLYTCLPVMLICLFYNNNDEIDLVISSKTATYRCAFSRYFSIYFVCCFTVCIIFFCLSFIAHASLITALFCCLSFACTSLLLMSFSLLVRLIIRTPYASVSIMIIIIIALRSCHEYFSKVNSSTYYYFDPYISHLYIAAENVWYLNRLIMLLVALTFMTISYVLLKKDKLFCFS